MTHLRRFGRLSLLMVAACGGDATDPNPVGGDRLAGAPGDPAVSAIEREPYEPRADDFSLGHPDLPSMLMSHRVAITAIGSGATVGQVNALLDELDAEIAGGIPGIAGQAGGLLAIRLPLTTHGAMEAALASIRARQFVESAAQDMELGTTDVTDQNGGSPAAWIWDSIGVQDTWGLVAVRVPQLWNFNAVLRASAQPPVLTGVLDVGFAEGHEDLPIFQYLGARTVHPHGTHVAGTIGASFNNKKGIDGVNPFSALVTRVVFNSGPATTYAAALWGLEDLIVGQPGLRVVNLSLGYNWYRAPVDVRTNVAAQNKAATHGAQVLTVLAALQAQGYRLPFIAAAAGNDSEVLPGVDARYGSPFANAALALGAAPITVVESDSLVAGGAAAYVRSVCSNSNGHLSAPGSQIWSSVPGGYAAFSGTSMATPHVAGLVGYLYALAPALPAPTVATNPVRDLLIANLQPGPRNGRPQIDAFASALALDGLLGGDAILRRLVDIDDGTSDGNLRLNAAGAAIESEDRAADNGRIDMADFRRWRDWLLQVEGAAGLVLDGEREHPKKDPNGDGAAGTAPQYEALYARGDFNGDGRMDRTGARPVAGRLGGQTLTDLQVLQQLFDDPDHTAAELPGLIASGDIHVDAEECLSLDGAAAALTTVRPAAGGADIGTPRGHDHAAPAGVVTLPAPADYSIRVEVLDQAGGIIGSEELEVPVALGEDVHLRPDCEAATVATLEGLPSAGSVANVSFQNANPSPACVQSAQSGDAVDPLPGLTLSATCPPLGAVSNGGVAMSARSATNVTYAVDVQGNALRSFTATAQASASAQGEGEIPGRFPSEAGKAFGSSSSNASLEFEVTAAEAEVTLTGQLTSETGDDGSSASASIRIGSYFAMAGRVGNSGPVLPNVAISESLRLPRGIYDLQVTAAASVGTFTLQPTSTGQAGFTVTLTITPSGGNP